AVAEALRESVRLDDVRGDAVRVHVLHARCGRAPAHRPRDGTSARALARSSSRCPHPEGGGASPFRVWARYLVAVETSSVNLRQRLSCGLAPAVLLLLALSVCGRAARTHQAALRVPERHLRISA